MIIISNVVKAYYKNNLLKNKITNLCSIILFIYHLKTDNSKHLQITITI